MATAVANVDVRMDIDTTNAEQNLSAFQGSIDLIGGSVEAVVGGLALFGIETEFIEDLEQGAIGAIAFADGIKRMSDGAVALAKNQKIAAAATRAFNAVANANPYVLLAVALIAVGAAFLVWARDADEAVKSTQDLIVENDKIIEGIKEEIKLQRDRQKSKGIDITLENKLADERKLLKEKETSINENLANSEKKIDDQITKSFKRHGEWIMMSDEVIEKKRVRKKLNDEEYISDQLLIEAEQEKADVFRENILLLENEIETRDRKIEEGEEADQTEAAIAKRKAIREAKALEDAAKLLVIEQNAAAAAIEIANNQALLQAELDADEDIKFQATLDQNALELFLLGEQYYERLNLAEGNAELIADVEARFADDKIALIKSQGERAAAEQKIIDEGVLGAQEALEGAKRANLTAGINFLSTLAGENEKVQNALFAVEQGAAIADIIVNTQKRIIAIGAANASLGIAGIPITTAQTIAAKISAGLSIATIGATSIAKFKGGGGGLDDVGGGGGGGVGAFGGFSDTAQSLFDREANISAPSGENGTPIQAYVVTGDINNGIEAQNQINNRRRFN